MPLPETDEIDVTELVERIEALEKENTAQKTKLSKIESRVADCEESVDAIAESFR